ncbi:peptidoglycan-binding domain-containing protein [Nonomuraea angiospora]|uniref:peptidoglycan-binding domain-containing protein n=1 Tax=Nonomuraea angiospora TaxID=46172 RepID=UPI00340806D6
MRVFLVFKWIAGIALLSVLLMRSGLIPGLPIDAGLSDCPPLQAGQADPIDGKDCVRMLQQKLRDSGYPGQQVNGKFGPLTKTNVVAFQKAAGLRPDGKAGPQTLAALTGGTTPTSPPGLDLGLPYCSDNVCRFVVPQGATHRAGTWLADNPDLAVKGLYIDLLAREVCDAVPRIAAAIAARLGCEKSVEKEIGDFIATLKSAAGKNACVRISVGLPVGGNSEFLRFTSVKCRS